MKIKELKENEPLKVIEVSRRCKHRSLNLGVVEWKRIKMRVFTDGEIVCEDAEIIQDIDEYYIGKSKYPYDVNTLKTKALVEACGNQKVADYIKKTFGESVIYYYDDLTA